MANTFTKAEQTESREALRDLLARASGLDGVPVIYTMLRSVSRSDTTRHISAYAVVDGRLVALSWHYDRADGKMAAHSTGGWANKVSGCGMDMGYHLADNIAAVAGAKNFCHEWI